MKDQLILSHLIRSARKAKLVLSLRQTSSFIAITPGLLKNTNIRNNIMMDLDVLMGFVTNRVLQRDV